MSKRKAGNVQSLDPEWVRLLYSEAWKQYCHEDNLGQARTNFFFGIQAALLGIIAATTPGLLKIGSAVLFSYRVDLGLLIIGFLCLMTGCLCLMATANWRYVTLAGREYVKLRLIQLVGLERLADVNEIGLATQEWEWTTHQQGHGPYHPFHNFESLQELEVKPIKASSGWLAMTRVITGIQILWVIVSIVGIAVIAAGIL